MATNAFAAGAPGPAGEAYSAPPDHLAGLRGPTSKGRRKEMGEEGKGKERGRREGIPHLCRGDKSPCIYRN